MRRVTAASAPTDKVGGDATDFGDGDDGAASGSGAASPALAAARQRIADALKETPDAKQARGC